MINLKEMNAEELKNLIAKATEELNGRTSTKKVKVTIALSKRHKCWAKTVTRVDTSVSTGYAFEGKFVKANELIELPVGTYILGYEQTGSDRNKETEARIYIVTENGLEKTGVETSTTKNDWALRIRDAAAELINK